MSKSSDKAIKKERGTSLTLEQYEMISAFLKNGTKPSRKSLKNAGLTGTLNGGPDSGKMKSPFFRFKSIAKRLAYRQSDDELIFKSNSKIVLPNSRFEEVIMFAHSSLGVKHLNITRTINKLSEEYTIGCRQFGISEENVRMVIKNCQAGSCAKKNKAGMGVLKNFSTSKISYEPNCSHFKESSPTPTKQPDDSTSVPKAPVSNGIPVTLVRLPNGAFGIQPSVNLSMPSFPPIQQMPVFDMQTFSSNHMQHTNYSPYSLPNSCLATGASDVNKMKPYLPFTLMENRVSSPVPIQVQLVNVGSQPIMSGQHMYLVNGATSFPNVSTEQISSHPIDLTTNSTKSLNLDSCVPDTLEQPALESKKHSNGNEVAPQHGYGSSLISALFLDQNNNDILSGKTENGVVNDTVCHGMWNSSERGQESMSFLNNNSHEEVIDLTLKGPEDKEMVEVSHSVEDTIGQGCLATHNIPGSCKLLPLPHKQIWYFCDDYARQTNPYERISMCIKDMKLDVMKSLAGSSQATERMKKKMHFIQEMIASQKNVTQYFTYMYQHSAV